MNKPLSVKDLLGAGGAAVVVRHVNALLTDATLVALTLPAPPLLLVGPLAQAPSPAPGCLPLSAAPQDRSRAVLVGDPLPERLRQAPLGVVGGFRQAPAPFLRLAIPDPFETATSVKLLVPPPDNDPPASAPGLPPKPPPPPPPPAKP